MKKIAVSVVAVLLCAWFILSWIDITADNNFPNPEHSRYNFFVVAFDR